MTYNVVAWLNGELVATGIATRAAAAREALKRGPKFEIRKAKGAGWELWLAPKVGAPTQFYVYSPEESEDSALEDMTVRWIDWNKQPYVPLADWELDQLSNLRQQMPGLGAGVDKNA